ncbi:hypothetical protein FOZ60_012013 [Perkinsus olseni]|uniref:Uncharacterized protein n=1 Tax=Perkinsus olseni TaxID=32597 RepID=A0A7J6PAD9_PEROL|nr:hypothetical protein FOZ60_012013 [Perkinsus olseni]
MLTLLGSSSSTTQGTNQLTVVPEDLPPITYRHTFVVIGRAQVYSAFVKMGSLSPAQVSYKYSSYIPRLSSATAVLNTALIFLLPLDPPPGNSKAATAASACTDCIRSLTGGDDARPSRWDTFWAKHVEFTVFSLFSDGGHKHARAKTASMPANDR